MKTLGIFVGLTIASIIIGLSFRILRNMIINMPWDHDFDVAIIGGVCGGVLTSIILIQKLRKPE
jgi:pilus assembly protein TadC